MIKTKNVVISGLGVIGPNVNSVQSFWEHLNKSDVVSPSEAEFDINLENKLVYLTEIESDHHYSKGDSLALYAVESALKDAGISESSAANMGVYFGSAMGSIDNLEKSNTNTLDGNLFNISELIARKYNFCGPNQVFSSACAASMYSIGMALHAIQEGEVDAMVVGGTEVASSIALSCFNRLGGLDSKHCRPFDDKREGTLFGEGAAALVLESEEHFLARKGKQPYASVKGFGWSCDGYHATAPEVSGRFITKAMNEALSEANISAQELDCIIPHGTGTQLNDEVEANALIRMIGDSITQVPVVPVKAMLGHNGGAAGGFSCVAAALICANQTVPSVINVDKSSLGIFLPKQTIKDVDVLNILISGFGFGGNNAVLVIGKYADEK